MCKLIEIKIFIVVVILVILYEIDLILLEKVLKEMIGGVVDFFEDEFVVLDIGILDVVVVVVIDWSVVVVLFKCFCLNMVVVCNVFEELYGGIVV